MVLIIHLLTRLNTQMAQSNHIQIIKVGVSIKMKKNLYESTILFRLVCMSV